MKKTMQFRKDEDGVVAVEFVLIFPLLFAVLCLMVDLAFIFNSRAEVLRVIQDANRNVSIGRLQDTDSAQTYIEQTLAYMTPNAVAQASIVAGVVTTVVTYPASDVMVSGLFTKLLSIDLTKGAQHRVEDWEA